MINAWIVLVELNKRNDQTPVSMGMGWSWLLGVTSWFAAQMRRGCQGVTSDHRPVVIESNMAAEIESTGFWRHGDPSQAIVHDIQQRNPFKDDFKRG